MDLRFVVTITDADPGYRVKPEGIEHAVKTLLENLEVDGSVVAIRDTKPVPA